MMQKFIYLIALITILTGLRAQESVTAPTELPYFIYGSNVDRPYVIYKNPTDGFYYIGSTSGNSDTRNQQGQISVLGFDAPLEYKLKSFANPVIISTEYKNSSVDTPKGMVAFDDMLVVTDMDSLIVFKKVEKNLPKQMGVLKIKGAKNLHSILKIDNDFYLTDCEQNGVFKITNLMDSEKREVLPLFKVNSPKGMIYDSVKNSLLIVSSKENNLYEYNLTDPKKSKSYQLAPPVPADQLPSHNGFIDLCMGNQKEIYLTNYANNKILIYFRDEDRPSTIKEPMKYAKVYLDEIRTPTSIIYDSNLNRIIFTEFYFNRIRFNKGLAPQLTSDKLEKLKE